MEGGRINWDGPLWSDPDAAEHVERRPVTQRRETRALESSSDRAVRLLEGWLNHALHMPEGAFPRIPLRLAREGGWGTVLSTPSGRSWAEGWWAGAFAAFEVDR